MFESTPYTISDFASVSWQRYKKQYDRRKKKICEKVECVKEYISFKVRDRNIRHFNGR